MNVTATAADGAPCLRFIGHEFDKNILAEVFKVLESPSLERRVQEQGGHVLTILKTSKCFNHRWLGVGES